MAEIKKYINKIINGDCAVILQKFPDECIDLVVTSPPYDKLRDYQGYSFDFKAVAKQLFRVTRQGGVVVWVVADSYVDGSETGTSFRHALFFMQCGFKLHDTMIYAKKNPWATMNNRYKQQFEYMFVFSKGKPKTFHPMLRKNAGAGGIQGGNKRGVDGKLYAKTQQGKPIKEYSFGYNIWYYGVTSSGIASKHPATFPIKLAEDHIYSWSNREDIILDPFFGSGTTGVAAKRFGRNYVGIEISRDYCMLARERIDKDAVQYKEDEVVRFFPAQEVKEQDAIVGEENGS